MKKRVIIATLSGAGLISLLAAGKPMFDSEGDYGYHKCMHNKHMKHYSRGDKNPHSLFKKIISDLDLSDAQKKQIKAIVSKQKELMKKERQALKEQRDMPDVSKFMTITKFDKEAFKKTIVEKHKQRKQKMQQREEARLNHRADTLEKVFAILTPEQRTKLIALSQKKES